MLTIKLTNSLDLCSRIVKEIIQKIKTQTTDIVWTNYSIRIGDKIRLEMALNPNNLELRDTIYKNIFNELIRNVRWMIAPKNLATAI